VHGGERGVLTGREQTLAELHAQRFAFASEEDFYAVWERLGAVRGEQVLAEDVDKKFADLLDFRDAGVDGAFLDFVSDELNRGAIAPDDCSFGELVQWALKNRLTEAARRRIERWRTGAWGVALLMVVAVVAEIFVGTD
jgi:hypothetical protein